MIGPGFVGQTVVSTGDGVPYRILMHLLDLPHVHPTSENIVVEFIQEGTCRYLGSRDVTQLV